MSGKDAVMYILYQIIGRFIGAAILYVLAPESGLGANTIQTGITTMGAVIAEIVFTFVFVLVVLGTTDSEKGAGNLAGLAIGLSLVLVHLVCIHYTGTSVNPARSIGPALLAGGQAMVDLWIFIVAPLVGAALAAVVWKILTCNCGKN
jgi:aquaporin Z